MRSWGCITMGRGGMTRRWGGSYRRIRIIPLASQGVQAWDRYAYVNNSPVNYLDPTGHMLDDGCRYEGCDLNREKENFEHNPVIEKLKQEKEKAEKEHEQWSRYPKLPYKNNQMTTCTNNQCKIGYAIFGTGLLLIGSIVWLGTYRGMAAAAKAGQWELVALTGLIGAVVGGLFTLGGIKSWKKSGCIPKGI